VSDEAALTDEEVRRFVRDGCAHRNHSRGPAPRREPRGHRVQRPGPQPGRLNICRDVASWERCTAAARARHGVPGTC
jgi:hypothetical protein